MVLAAFSRGIVVLVGLWLAAGLASAGVLTLIPNTTAVLLAPGDTITIQGRVSNVTGQSLMTTDIFLNFSGFPSDTLDINQLLGSPDLLIPDRTLSPELDLFSIGLLSGAVAGATYAFDWFAVDVNGVFSDIVTMTVSVVGTGIPEPASLALVCMGLFGVALTRQRRVAPARKALAS